MKPRVTVHVTVGDDKSGRAESLAASQTLSPAKSEPPGKPDRRSRGQRPEEEGCYRFGVERSAAAAALAMRAIALLALCSAPALATGCPEAPAFYEDQGYRISEVQVDSPLPLGRPAAPALQGQAFLVSAWQEDSARWRPRTQTGGSAWCWPHLAIATRGAHAQDRLPVVFAPEAHRPVAATRAAQANRGGGLPDHSGDAVRRLLVRRSRLSFYTHTGPNYTASSAIQFGGCGLFGWRNTVRLHAPAVTSSIPSTPAASSSMSSTQTEATRWAV